MKILLINPNRYRTPPVPPLGLEYLASALARTGHEYRILDLCFAEAPAADIEAAIRDFQPDVAGMTVRNIDTVLFQNNIFFLDDIRSLVEAVSRHGIPVIAGGVGYSFIPGGVLGCIGADYGISGPGEKALPLLLDRLEREPVPTGTILNGWEIGIDPDASTEREGVVDHARYVREGGLLGFETQKGCHGSCSYCSEGRGKVLFKNPARVAEEIHGLARRGFTDFHLCDTEFNQDLTHCHVFLEKLASTKPDIRWALYMKAAPYDNELFRLLKSSGAHLITLSLPTGGKSIEHAREIRNLTRKHSIRLAVDYLCGFPGDTPESIRQDIEALRRIEPDTVGVNSILRLHPGLKVTAEIFGDSALRKRLLGETASNPELVRPVFYQHITAEILQEIIGGDSRFHIEGFERTSNYQRLHEEE